MSKRRKPRWTNELPKLSTEITNVHSHKCVKCGNIWSHSDDTADQSADVFHAEHTCKVCGGTPPTSRGWLGGTAYDQYKEPYREAPICIGEPRPANWPCVLLPERPNNWYRQIEPKEIHCASGVTYVRGFMVHACNEANVRFRHALAISWLSGDT